MSTGDDRARDGDRDAAVRIIEAALADGRIIQADRDVRVASVRTAHTRGELDMITHGLATATPSAPEVPQAPTYVQPPRSGTAPAELLPETPVPSPTVVSYGPPQTIGVATGTTRKRSGPTALIVGIVAIVVFGACIAGVIGLVVSSVGDGVDSLTSGVTDSRTLAPGVEPTSDDDLNVLTRNGYADLVAALEEETGSSQVFEAVLYPTYAVVTVPVDASSQRSTSYYWNGELDESGTRATSTQARFDLEEIDPGIVVRLVKRVVKRVDDPTSWYAIVDGPSDTFADKRRISAYASNEYSETAYILAQADGTVVYASQPEE